MPERYELKTVADFFKVPAEKRAACIHDFGLWLEMHDGFRELFSGISGVRAHTETFGWIDDDKHDAVIRTDIVHTSEPV